MKHVTLSRWCQDSPEEVQQFQRVLMVASCSKYLRFKHLRDWPSKVFFAADTRNPLAERQAVSDEFMAARDSQLDKAFSVPFRERLKLSGESLMSPPTQRKLVEIARRCPMTIAPIEFRHARNRRRATFASSWAQFAATYVNEESRLRGKADAAAAQALARRVGWQDACDVLGSRAQAAGDGAAAEKPVGALGDARYTRRKTAYQLFKIDTLRNDARAGWGVFADAF